MKNISEQQFNELSKQAYIDSINSRQANIDKYRNKTDPILQQNDYYVSKQYNIILNLQFAIIKNALESSTN